MLVKYLGPLLDFTGYGEAARHDIGALKSVDIDIRTDIVRYTHQIADYGELGQLAASLTDTPGEYNTKILHTTPNEFPNYLEEDKRIIGRVFWETDKLPIDFAEGCSKVSEIWTGSKYNELAIRNSGVQTPVKIVPQAIDTSILQTTIEPFEVPQKDTYKFYSIFEWTERKNPRALLEAYFNEFQNGEDVSLSIKTYVDNFSDLKDQTILSQIQFIKKRLNLPKYPPVYLYMELMNRSQVYRYHNTFDCFVSAHRGEGWGIPQMEALLMGRPVISTNLGGIHEYLINGDNAYLLPFEMVQVQGNRNPLWYTNDQKWAEVDTKALRDSLRFVFENQDEAKRVGKAGQEVVIDKFSFEKVGIDMKNYLQGL